MDEQTACIQVGESRRLEYKRAILRKKCSLARPTKPTEISKHHDGDCSVQNVRFGVVGDNSLDLVSENCTEKGCRRPESQNVENGRDDRLLVGLQFDSQDFCNYQPQPGDGYLREFLRNK